VSPDRVSVIVPIHDAERYLDEAVQSILEQMYRPLELLLVDDGSTDGSARIASSLASTHPEIQLLQLRENLGPATARNRGLAQARGAFITFLDADDAMLTERLAWQVRYLGEHPGVDLVLGAEELAIEPDAPPEMIRRRRARGPGPRFHVMSMMARRDAFRVVGGFDPSYRVAEDLDWLFRARAAGLVVGTLDRVLTRHRLHQGNLSYRTHEINAGILRSLRQRLRERQHDDIPARQRHHPVR
jgi:glycosyltransferase involved in cell wall biosynthesis